MSPTSGWRQTFLSSETVQQHTGSRELISQKEITGTRTRPIPEALRSTGPWKGPQYRICVNLSEAWQKEQRSGSSQATDMKPNWATKTSTLTLLLLNRGNARARLSSHGGLMIRAMCLTIPTECGSSSLQTTAITSSDCGICTSAWTKNTGTTTGVRVSGTRHVLAFPPSMLTPSRYTMAQRQTGISH